MLAQERYEQILDLLEENRSVKASMLVKLFNVSIETIRRDLEYLEKEGHLKRVYGGAVLEKISEKQVAFQTREKECQVEKKEIASIAIRFIKEGQSIAMDASTTNLEIAKELKKKFERLTVITNSLAVARELSDMNKYTVILAGGILKGDQLSLVGDVAEDIIGSFNVDMAFIGVSGVSLYAGLTDQYIDELRVQKKMVDIAQNTIALADSSKFDVVCLQKIADLDGVSMIITDSKIKNSILEKYLKNGIKVINQ